MSARIPLAISRLDYRRPTTKGTAFLVALLLVLAAGMYVVGLAPTASRPDVTGVVEHSCATASPARSQCVDRRVFGAATSLTSFRRSDHRAHRVDHWRPRHQMSSSVD
jgi:hypothetical protein